MRLVVGTLATLLVFFAIDGVRNSAAADPYRWCAMYRAKGATNCYFVTLAQCQAAISGVGGFCQPNNFYDGRPVVTAEDGIRRSRSRVR
jgi:Protein of unknown function (DUF3551)